MKIEVYKSEFTGEIFEDEQVYKEHVEECQKELEEFTIKGNVQKEIKSLRLDLDNLEEFRLAFVELKKKENKNVHDIVFSRLNFTNVSNSHSSPVGKQGNFSRDKSKPLTHKGWLGEITIISYTNEPGFSSDIIGYDTGINTGSGGYRGSDYGEMKDCYVTSYELRLFLDDFPLIKDKYNKYLKLTGDLSEHNEDVSNKQREAKEHSELLTEILEKKTPLEMELEVIDGKIKMLNSEFYKETSRINTFISEQSIFEGFGELNKLSKLF